VPASPPTVAATSAGRSTDWLALGAASRLLGVDPDTLRRWADEGRVEAFTTPGGHRRFARRSLERIVATRRTGPTGRLRALGATPDRVSAVYRRRYEVPAPGAPDPRSSVPATEHDAYREQGRLLVAALLAHLDAPTAAARDRAAQDALGLTADLGRRLAAMGMPLGEAVAMFVSARRPFLTELGALARRRELDAARLSGLYEAATAVLDRLLFRLIDSFSAAAPTPPGAAASTPSTRTPR
jgi:excisionase family DNA binding protein